MGLQLFGSWKEAIQRCGWRVSFLHSYVVVVVVVLLLVIAGILVVSIAPSITQGSRSATVCDQVLQNVIPLLAQLHRFTVVCIVSIAL